MRVPYSWLKEYVDLTESAQEAATLLQSVGVPVEGVEREGPEVTGVITGHVVTVDPHPDADRLKVAQVDMGGGERLQIVTAAPNIRADMRVAVATHGALLASGTKIKKGKLRGVMSEGMFCSAQELGMDGLDLPPEQREGILDLAPGVEPGQEIGRVLAVAEEVLVLETFANRPDQLSLLGVARELAAKLGRPLRLPETSQAVNPAGEGLDPGLVEIRDLQGCPRYIARVVEDVQVGPSPDWMVKRLAAAGLRSINNVVDVTNYVMWETGQPLHAFDMDLLAGPRIVVRRTEGGERITTIDGAEHELPAETLIIADADKPVAVAGVMGGLHSEVGDRTKRVLLEAASFHSGDVRRASLRLGLRSESSKRFEKGMDYERVAFASARAAHLLATLAGRLHPGAVDAGTPPPERQPITLRPQRVKQVLGVDIPAEDTRRILSALEFQVSGDGSLQVVAPSHRQDVTSEADLIEEIARHYGYDNLPTTVPHGQPKGAEPPEDELEEWARDTMARLGWTEILTPSLHNPELLGRYRLEADPAVIMNPLSEDQRVLRPSLLPHMSEVVLRNLRVRNRELRLFEVSRVFEAVGNLVREPRRLGLALSVPGLGILDLKGALERVGEAANVRLELEPSPRAWLHPGRSAALRAGDREIGWAGELHPQLAAELDLEGPLAIAEVDLDALGSLRTRPQHRAISRFPAVERDLALVVAEDVPAGRVGSRLRDVGGDLVGTVACFDVYRGPQVPEGQKSLAYRTLLQAPDRTLTEDEIERVVRKMVKVAEREFGARLRE